MIRALSLSELARRCGVPAPAQGRGDSTPSGVTRWRSRATGRLDQGILWVWGPSGASMDTILYRPWGRPVLVLP